MSPTHFRSIPSGSSTDVLSVMGRTLFAAGVVALGARLAWRLTVRATFVRMNFYGSVDLSNLGGPSSSKFRGSVTWDPFKESIGLPGPEAFYRAEGLTFWINSTKYTSAAQAPIIGVFDDLIGVQTYFDPALRLGDSPMKVNIFHGILQGPAPLFPKSHALPRKLTFLSSVTSSRSRFESVAQSIRADGTFVGARPSRVRLGQR